MNNFLCAVDHTVHASHLCSALVTSLLVFGTFWLHVHGARTPTQTSGSKLKLVHVTCTEKINDVTANHLRVVFLVKGPSRHCLQV